MGVRSVPHKVQASIKFLTQQEAASKSANHSRKNLYYAIEHGEYPGWNVCVQTMTSLEAEEVCAKQKINVFGLIRIWPQKQFPLRNVGEFFLNENVKNYFAEIEQVTYDPAHMPPGI